MQDTKFETIYVKMIKDSKQEFTQDTNQNTLMNQEKTRFEVQERKQLIKIRETIQDMNIELDKQLEIFIKVQIEIKFFNVSVKH